LGVTLIINIPPRSLKSLMGSVSFPAFVLGHDPSKRIIVVSYGEDLARISQTTFAPRYLRSRFVF
jgi:hypothetical protein